MTDVLHTMISLYGEILFLIAVVFTTDPWEAARRLYLMVQYAKMFKDVLAWLKAKFRK